MDQKILFLQALTVLWTEGFNESKGEEIFVAVRADLFVRVVAGEKPEVACLAHLPQMLLLSKLCQALSAWTC